MIFTNTDEAIALPILYGVGITQLSGGCERFRLFSWGATIKLLIGKVGEIKRSIQHIKRTAAILVYPCSSVKQRGR
jgi:hypothetical protein